VLQDVPDDIRGSLAKLRQELARLNATLVDSRQEIRCPSAQPFQTSETAMIRRLVVSMLCGGAIFAFAAQAQTPDTVIAGPYGIPRLVRAEGGQWSEPIKVFSDANQVV
jgi:hypothetical protein